MAVSGFLDWHHETGDTRKHPERASPNGFCPTGCPFRRSNHIHCATPSIYLSPIMSNELSITEQKDFGVLPSAPTDMVGWALTKLAIPGGPHGEHTLFIYSMIKFFVLDGLLR